MMMLGEYVDDKDEDDDESNEGTDCDEKDANSHANLAVRRAFMASIYSVSYTHLTLPTIYSV